VAHHRAWPHLAFDIARAAAVGRDPLGLLTTAASVRSANGEDPTAAIAPVSRTVRHLTGAGRGMDAVPVLPPELRYRQAALRVFGPDNAEEIVARPAWAAVHNAVHKAEQLGHTPDTTLRYAHARIRLAEAHDPAALLAWRIGIHNHNP